jgi:hypothetical protein
MKDIDGSSLLYRLVHLAGSPFRYRVLGMQNIRDRGPALFVANHLGSIGPLACITSIPVRFYPWVVAEMADYRRAPRYLYDDFVHPTWHLGGTFGLAVSFVVSRISVTLIRGVGSVSVEGSLGESFGAFRRSLELLSKGKNVLVFPEDEDQPADPATRLHPWMCGFVGLCGMHEREIGQKLPIYPMAVHPDKRTIAIAPAEFVENGSTRRLDVRRTCDRLKQRVADLYLGEQARTDAGTA